MKAAAYSLLLLALVSCGRREEEFIKSRVERHLKVAVALEEQGQLDGAIAEYGKALALVGTGERWKTLATEWRAIIRQLEAQKEQIAVLTARFGKWKAIAGRGDATDREWLLREGSDLLSESDLWSLPWRPELWEALQKRLPAVDKP